MAPVSYLKDCPELRERIKEYGISTFVETGCGNGDGLQYAIELGIQNRYSCDLNPKSVEKCKELGNVVCGSSVWFLYTGIFGSLGFSSPALFWLDAHFPEKFGTMGDTWPLLEELKILSKKPGIEKDVIICDDIHCIQDPENPTREDGPGHDWEPVNGTIQELINIFKDTHVYTLYNISTGILVFEPK